MRDIGVSIDLAFDYVKSYINSTEQGLAENDTGVNLFGPPNAILQYGIAITQVILQVRHVYSHSAAI